jgi:hypothetical protein
MKDPVIGERRAHPRIALNALSLEPGPLDVQVDTVARLGVSLITPVDRDVHASGLPESARAIRDAGLGVAALTCTGFAFATPAAGAWTAPSKRPRRSAPRPSA